jgi:uncharacterized protein RhaS with RHS repeats
MSDSENNDWKNKELKRRSFIKATAAGIAGLGLGFGLGKKSAKNYVPALGRFLSSDPIGFGGGDTNLYRYVGNNPIRYNDPSGLKYRTCKRKLNGAPGMAGPFYHEYIDFDSGSDYSFAPADGEGLFNSTSQNKSENPGNDSCGEWSKDSSNDKMIRDKARQNMTKDYNLNSYNCQDFVGDTLNGF